MYEKYAGGTKVQIHGTIVKYWVQNTHGTKWFWSDYNSWGYSKAYDKSREILSTGVQKAAKYWIPL